MPRVTFQIATSSCSRIPAASRQIGIDRHAAFILQVRVGNRCPVNFPEEHTSAHLKTPSVASTAGTLRFATNLATAMDFRNTAPIAQFQPPWVAGRDGIRASPPSISDKSDSPLRFSLFALDRPAALSELYTDLAWFHTVDQSHVYLKIFRTRLILALVAGAVFAAFIYGQGRLALRNAKSPIIGSMPDGWRPVPTPHFRSPKHSFRCRSAWVHWSVGCRAMHGNLFSCGDMGAPSASRIRSSDAMSPFICSHFP